MIGIVGIEPFFKLDFSGIGWAVPEFVRKRPA